MAKVSVIVPVYNAERYLLECIESILNQTYKNIELILINDGSTDNSLNICKSFAKRDNRVKILSIENSGVSKARNIGIDSSTGEYITFVDSDDWIELNMVEFSVNKALESKSDVVIWSYYKNYINNEVPLSLIPGGNQKFNKNKEILYLKSIYQFYGMDKLSDTVSAGTTWCKLYKSELIKNNKIKFKEELVRSQDVIFSLEAFSKANMIRYYDENLYHYRINEFSTCSGNRYINDTMLPFNSLLSEMQMFSDHTSNFDEAINARTIQVILWHLDHKFFHKNYKANLLERRRKVIDLIDREPYRTAIKKVNTSLLPKKEKTMLQLLRKKLVIVFFFIYKAHSFYLKYKSNKYE